MPKNPNRTDCEHSHRPGQGWVQLLITVAVLCSTAIAMIIAVSTQSIWALALALSSQAAVLRHTSASTTSEIHEHTARPPARLPCCPIHDPLIAYRSEGHSLCCRRPESLF